MRKAFALCIDRQEIVDTLIAPINPDATVLNNRIYMPDVADYEDNSGGSRQRTSTAPRRCSRRAATPWAADGVYAEATASV